MTEDISSIKGDTHIGNIPVLSYCKRTAVVDFSLESHEHEAEQPGTHTTATNRLSTRHYDDLALIDWDFEYKQFSNLKKLEGLAGFQRFLRTYRKWLILITASVIAGLMAIALDYVLTYLTDLKYGHCSSGLFKLRTQCDTDDWMTWSSTISNSNDWYFTFTNNIIIVILLSLLYGFTGTKIAQRQSQIFKSGIVEMKLFLSGFKINELLDMNLVINKIISLMLVIPSGLWLGYEGPLVHISSGILNFVLSRFSGDINNEAITREIVSSGVSIGIGLAFNAPIGGVLFGLEQIQSYYPVDKLMWNAFVSATVSVAVLESFHPFKGFDTNASFRVDLKNNWLFVELFPYMFLGLLCGGMGILFNKLNLRFARYRVNKIADNRKLQVVEILVVIIVTNVLAYPFAITRSTLLEFLETLFTDCTDDSTTALCTKVPEEPSQFPFNLFFTLSFTVVQAFALTAYTYGCSVPGGVLIPSLVIGGLTGRLVGSVLEYFQNISSGGALFATCFNEKKQCISPASYAVVGSASFLASVTRMNVTAVVIMFELTGALTYIIPIMLGVFFARFLNDLFLSSSIYESWLKFNYKDQYLDSNLEDTLQHSELSVLNVDKVMTNEGVLPILYEDDQLTLQDLDNIAESSFYGYPVLKSHENPVLLGHISQSDVRYLLHSLRLEGVISLNTFIQFTGDVEKPGYYSVRPYMTGTNELITVNPSYNVLTIYEIIDKLKLNNVFVCQENFKFKGMINRKDIIELVNNNGV